MGISVFSLVTLLIVSAYGDDLETGSELWGLLGIGLTPFYLIGLLLIVPLQIFDSKWVGIVFLVVEILLVTGFVFWLTRFLCVRYGRSASNSSKDQE